MDYAIEEIDANKFNICLRICMDNSIIMCIYGLYLHFWCPSGKEILLKITKMWLKTINVRCYTSKYIHVEWHRLASSFFRQQLSVFPLEEEGVTQSEHCLVFTKKITRKLSLLEDFAICIEESKEFHLHHHVPHIGWCVNVALSISDKRLSQM